MDCRKIIIEYLKANGYDGLCNTDLPCGCTLDDFMPCVEFDINECKAGYEHKDGLIYLHKEE